MVARLSLGTWPHDVDIIFLSGRWFIIFIRVLSFVTFVLIPIDVQRPFISVILISVRSIRRRPCSTRWSSKHFWVLVSASIVFSSGSICSSLAVARETVLALHSSIDWHYLLHSLVIIHASADSGAIRAEHLY